MQPVIHHCELCVNDIDKTLARLKTYGFRPFAKRENAFAKSVAAKLNSIIFVVTEKSSNLRTDNKWKGSVRDEPFTILCSRCEDETGNDDHVDTVFNVALNVKDVKTFTERIRNHDDRSVIYEPTTVENVEYSVIKSTCGNVVHTLINKDNYDGFFLPGFNPISSVNDVEDCNISDGLIDKEITHIDHVTLACYSGCSNAIINWYEKAFGMKKFSISKDDYDDGLILKEGVGLRLRAMQYWMCSETSLVLNSSFSNKERSPNSFLLVVVESLPGQKNCNVEAFLKDHRCPGVEHIAFSSQNISKSVSKMTENGVKFRLPPDLYYNLKAMPHIKEIVNLNIREIEKLGILLDREDDEEDSKPKYLLQIFAKPFFDRQTFFIEVIERSGATGLGSGNILALVRSIREDERRKAMKGDKSLSTKDTRTH